MEMESNSPLSVDERSNKRAKSIGENILDIEGRTTEGESSKTAPSIESPTPTNQMEKEVHGLFWIFESLQKRELLSFGRVKMNRHCYSHYGSHAIIGGPEIAVLRTRQTGRTTFLEAGPNSWHLNCTPRDCILGSKYIVYEKS